jgi:hypothetical protein
MMAAITSNTLMAASNRWFNLFGRILAVAASPDATSCDAPVATVAGWARVMTAAVATASVFGATMRTGADAAAV